MTEDVKEQILQATLAAVNELGTQKVTTREIARRAGVNSAALHYYFGTKEQLVDAAFARMSQEMLAAFTFMHFDGLSSKEKLSKFLHAFVGQAVKFPGIIKSVLAGQMHPKVAETMGKGFGIARDMIRELSPESDQRTLGLLVVQLISSAMYPILLRDQLLAIMGLDYFYEEHRDIYFRLIIERQFGQ